MKNIRKIMAAAMFSMLLFFVAGVMNASAALPEGPAITTLEASDDAHYNTILYLEPGLMELSTDGGVAWNLFEPATMHYLPDISGNLTLQVRYAATAEYLAGPPVTFIFTLDISEYSAAVNSVFAVDYTPASWADFQAVIAANPIVSTDNQQKVFNITAIIIAAKENLITKVADTALTNAKNSANALVASDYANFSIVTSALALPENSNTTVLAKTTAINDAISSLITNFIANNLATTKSLANSLTQSDYANFSSVENALLLSEKNQTEAMAKIAAINSAIASLVFAGKADLDSAKTIASGLNPTDYLDFAAVDAALLLSEGTNAQIIAKTTAINDAIAGLIHNADLTAYNNAISAVIEADYSVDSWITYQVVVSSNQMTNKELQAVVNVATAAILDAQTKLVFASQLALMQAIGDSNAKNESDYTMLSWNVLANARLLPTSTNAQTAAKVAAINGAIAGLVFVGQAELDSAIFDAQDLIDTDYSNFNIVTDALNLGDSTNVQVIAKTTAIRNAIAGLITYASLAEEARIKAQQAAAALAASNEAARVEALALATANAEAARIQAEQAQIAHDIAAQKKADKKKADHKKAEKKKHAAQKLAVKKVAEFKVFQSPQHQAAYKTVASIKKTNPARFNALMNAFNKYNKVSAKLNLRPTAAINMFRSYVGYSTYLNYANKLKK